MAKGISVFLGLDWSLEDNLEYLTQAAQAGFNRVFTSLHIPEANYSQLIAEFKQILDLATQLNMTVIADISPNAYQYLQVEAHDLAAFKKIGLAGIRLDYGFAPELIASYTNNDVGLLIELNASTMSAEFMQQIMNVGANAKNISACHNYYPRQNTGISLESLQRKNQIFHHHDVPVSGFIGMKTGRRGPLYEGLPTLEFTRSLTPQVSAQILLAAGIDHVFIGDAQADLPILQRIGKLTPDIIELDVANYLSNPVYSELFQQIHTNRPDAAADVIRSQESRLMLLENNVIRRDVLAENCVVRNKGSITIDNIAYGRYSGELQICKRDLAADERVNVIGRVSEDSLHLLDYIGDNQRFKLVL
ncbi:MAG TPA: MupG family TIM beta-alpha barrel fold protein [Burkholderiales bacterium]|nr:MupG family TIM beta-alpha barrel fold protein [Burkholderiales bacterium]